MRARDAYKNDNAIILGGKEKKAPGCHRYGAGKARALTTNFVDRRKKFRKLSQFRVGTRVRCCLFKSPGIATGG